MRLRRSRCLTCYWHDGLFVVHPYPHGTPTSLHPVVAEILTAFDTWTAPVEAGKALDHLAPETIEEAAHALYDAGVLLAEDSPEAALDQEISEVWATWMPEGSFFHYATQDVLLNREARGAGHDASLDGTGEMPALFTGYPEAPRLPLPRRPLDLRAPYEHVLYERRTHRDFTREPVALATLAGLLSTSFGPVDYIDCGRGALYRRTSPAGGARNEIDAYVGVLNVEGAAPGWYHYNALHHTLELLSAGFTPERAAHLCADQEWGGGAAFLVLLAARVERMSVKYPTPRCYRVCLLNAGHLGQTFALTATALGLGPAQTGAFHDSLVAASCTLDNSGHTPLYLLAAGHPHPEPQDAPPPATVDTFRETRLY